MNNNILMIFPDWEERAYQGFTNEIDVIQFKEILLINYADGLHQENTSANVERIKKTAEKKQLKVTLFSLSKLHSIVNWNYLSEHLQKLSLETLNVYLDITTMPREIIWMILYNLKSKVPKIHYFYHKPKDYNPEWLTREPDTPRLLFKHSGVIDPAKQTALLVVPGFDSERVGQLVNFFDPKKVIVGLQTGNQFDNLRRNTMDNLRLEMSFKVVKIDAYSNDLAFKEIAAAAVEELAGHNLVVASLGPKLTALSMYRLHQLYPEIALSYIPCKEYNANYSTGYGGTVSGDFQLSE